MIASNHQKYKQSIMHIGKKSTINKRVSTITTTTKIAIGILIAMIIMSLGVSDIVLYNKSHNDINAMTQHNILQVAFAQNSDLDMDLQVTDDEKIIIFAGFSIAVIGIFLFLARDIILRRKTEYDSEEYESKKERTYEKYHSEWSDDYEEVGTRKRSKSAKELFDDTSTDDGQLPDYYKVLKINNDATKSEIKKAYRQLAKESHPDRARQSLKNDNDVYKITTDPDSIMAEINKAYEILSDDDLRKKYDAYQNKNNG